MEKKKNVSDCFIDTFVKAIESLKSHRENHKGNQQFLAMYSSVFGGITTDPAAMVIPIDDHMVHRGHGVFDTAAITDGLVSGCALVLLSTQTCIYGTFMNLN